MDTLIFLAIIVGIWFVYDKLVELVQIGKICRIQISEINRKVPSQYANKD